MHSRLAAGAALALVVLAGCQSNVRSEHVALTATMISGQPAYSLPVINAVQHQKVVIDLTNNTGTQRGFTIDGYGVSKTIEPGAHAVVTFKADQAGIFTIHDQIDTSAQRSRLVVAQA
jgi:FtsP/CotA-like multicopper oxidase with cupredoxin domain